MAFYLKKEVLAFNFLKARTMSSANKYKKIDIDLSKEIGIEKRSNNV